MHFWRRNTTPPAVRTGADGGGSGGGSGVSGGGGGGGGGGGEGGAWQCRPLDPWVRRSIPSGLSPGMLFVRQIASARHETPNFTNPVLMASVSAAAAAADVGRSVGRAE